MKYMKAIIVYILIAGIMVIAAGCIGNKGGNNSNNDSEIEKAIASRVNSFKEAVEDYDVEKMLDFLFEDEFVLNIEEGSSYQKDYSTLVDELKEDEGKQLYWRRTTEGGGNGYILYMELEEIVYTNTSSTGSIVTVPFTIKEEAANIPRIVTDTGTMVCDMVKLKGEWYCQSMTIHFNTGEIAAQGITNKNRKVSGFGFGNLCF